MKLHYTPTYSSWLNQVELWFSKIQRDLIARGVFTPVPDLSRELLRYIAHYNKAPKASKWSWRNPSKQLPPTRLSFDTPH
jgi:transposase